MSNQFAYCAGIALIAVLALHLQAESGPFNGNWMTITDRLDDGTDYSVYFQLKQTGSEITGRVIYPWSIIKISSGRANGNKLRFTQHVW